MIPHKCLRDCFCEGVEAMLCRLPFNFVVIISRQVHTGKIKIIQAQGRIQEFLKGGGCRGGSRIFEGGGGSRRGYRIS